jgi:thiamine biosynthesis lipoprotein
MNTEPQNSRRTFLKLSSSLALGAALRPFSSFARAIVPLKQIERATFTMGSIVTIKAFCEDEKRCNLAIDAAFQEMKEIDRLMSVFDNNSQLSLVNLQSGEKEVHVDHRIIEVLESARTYNDDTEGAFDVTIEPLMELYGFRDEKNDHHFPSDKEIAETLAGVGMNNVIVNDRQSTIALTNVNTRLDYGGIAVGYAIDRAVGILKSHGIESALINHSGDIYAIGSPPEEDGWEIGITDPMRKEDIITTLRIKDKALSTSGNYQNFIQADGNTIGHILNPANGRTASSILSGTTIAETALQADALSTGFFVMGFDKSKTIIRQSKNLQFIAVVKDGEDETILRI